MKNACHISYFKFQQIYKLKKISQTLFSNVRLSKTNFLKLIFFKIAFSYSSKSYQLQKLWKTETRSNRWPTYFPDLNSRNGRQFMTPKNDAPAMTHETLSLHHINPFAYVMRRIPTRPDDPLFVGRENPP